jgi:pyridoxamine 5'-phosphate oxidase
MDISQAKDAQILEPNAMCLSTCSENRPSGRMVLLKDFNDRGFSWFTNYNSRKASDLEANPVASLTFWWGDLERLVCSCSSLDSLALGQ